MKKYNLILIALCLLIAAGQQTRAQVAIATAKELAFVSRGVARAAKKGNPLYKPGSRTGLYSFQVTHLLKRRAARERQRAVALQKTIPWDNETIHNASLPVSNFRNTTQFIRPFLQNTLAHNNKQIALYLTAQENRLYAREVRRLHQEVWPQLEQLLPRLRQAAQHTPQPEDPLAFLAHSIPAEVNTIAIGEVHGFKEIRLSIAHFLSLLRKERPNQEIFIFSELIEQGKELPLDEDVNALGEEVLAGHEKIWQTAYQNNIRIVGLEPKEVMEDAQLRRYSLFEHEDFEGRITSFFASLLGLKWRNEMFTKTMEQYRAEHPDALFIIHTGATHVGYSAPFSLTAKLDPAKTFVLHLFPTKKKVSKRYFLETDDFTRCLWDPVGAQFNGTESFEQPFLYWQDSQLAHVTGADAYLQAEERSLDKAQQNQPTK